MSTIGIDFDGVLSEYTGWKGGNATLDPPVTGAIEAIRAYQDAGLEVCIYSSRAEDGPAKERIRKWLQAYGLESKRIQKIAVTNLKPPAIVYLDDRAWCFKGVFPTPTEILSFRTWQGY
jgi:hypothetical protein